MTTAPEDRQDELWSGFQNKIRRGFIIGTVGYVIVITVILATLWTLVDSVRRAETEYETVKLQLGSAQRDLAATQSQYETLLSQKQAADAAIAASQNEIAELRKQLDQIYDFKQHVVPVTEVDEKMAYAAAGPQAFDILRLAIEDAKRGLPFSGANTPAGGFTSPGYAQYLLGKVGITAPIAALPERRDPPENGDIITYAGGYHMFYFHIPELHKEFVIGMTPQGVLALEPKFGTMLTVYAAIKRRG